MKGKASTLSLCHVGKSFSLFSEVYKQGVMDMGGYEKLPNTDFSIKNITFFFEKYFFQNLILGIWESQGESLELSGRAERL